MPVNVFSVSMDCWLCGVSVHISTSTPPQIQHFPPSGLRLWDVPPPPLTLTLTLALTLTLTLALTLTLTPIS